MVPGPHQLEALLQDRAMTRPGFIASLCGVVLAPFLRRSAGAVAPPLPIVHERFFLTANQGVLFDAVAGVVWQEKRDGQWRNLHHIGGNYVCVAGEAGTEIRCVVDNGT